ncbi:MAG: FAD-dependent oxidoreductase, partial [Gammaproteobacteria bacterium]|nr:FAD-dependent oxidoreductase [Gammaproteobacteria bacterium]
SLGAEIRYPVNFVGATRSDNNWQVSLQVEGEAITHSARILVNAGGPWVNAVLQQVNPALVKHQVELVQGTHIIVPEQPSNGIYYLEASDQRAVFVMPWGEQTMIGTTEKSFSGQPDDVAPGDDEIDYLLATVSAYFPKFKKYNRENISCAFAGLRVLPGEGKSAFGKARDTLIYEDTADAPGLITLYGGKLTAYRATAEQVLQKIKLHLPAHKIFADTKHLPLS